MFAFTNRFAKHNALAITSLPAQQKPIKPELFRKELNCACSFSNLECVLNANWPNETKIVKEALDKPAVDLQDLRHENQ